MNPCDEVTGALAEGRPLSASLRLHLETCEACRQFAAMDTGLRSPGEARALEPSAALRAAVRDDHAPVARRSPLARGAAPLAVAVFLAGGVLLVRPRPDLPHLAPAMFWTAALMWMALVALGLGLVFARGRFGLGPSAMMRWTYVVVSFALFEAFAWGMNPRERYTMAHVGMHEWMRHWTCAPLGLAAAAAVGVFVLRAARRQEAVSPATAGAVAGAASGFAAILALHAGCGFPDPLHLAVVHVIPVVVALLVGVKLGRDRMSA